MSIYGNRPAERAVGTKLVVFWLIAGVPLIWGVWNTLVQAAKLFQ